MFARHSHFALRLLLIVLTAAVGPLHAARPRVFVFTDINIDAGDPDDRQSLVHLFWYADELEITGIVPDRWEAHGLEACEQVLEAYARDHADLDLGTRGYPAADVLRSRIARNFDEAMLRFHDAALGSDEPLWVLVWGNMVNVGRALRAYPQAVDRVRLVTIATGLMHEPERRFLPPDWERTEPCRQPNWNGAGRDELFADPRFRSLWWLEMNWSYSGMFTGPEPAQMLEKLTRFGAMGRHMEDVIRSQPWARYFRVGDTPTVLYLIDPRRDESDPARRTWAGQFRRPMPEERPWYFTDDAGTIEWDYHDPCRTWAHHELVHAHSAATLERERPAMYQALLDKLNHIYGHGVR